MRTKEKIAVWAVLLTAVLVCYSSTLNAGFIWDDESLVLNNPLVRAPLWAFERFKQDIINSGFTYTVYYRPVQIISYALDYRLGGMNPFVFHLISLIIYFINCLLLFLLALKLSGKGSAAFLSALFFCIHPFHSAAISYVSGRADLLFVFFGLLFMIFFVYFREKKKFFFLVLSVAMLCLSVLSKEAGVVFPVLCLLMDLVLLKSRFISPRSRARENEIASDKKLGAGFTPHIFNFTVVILYISIHAYFLHARYPVFNPKGAGIPGILTFFKMAGDYVVNGLFPFDPGMRHSIHAGGNYAAIAAVTTCAVFIFSMFKSLRRILFFSLISILVSLLPFFLVSGYFGVLAEHWMYLADVFLFLFLASFFVAVFEKNGHITKITAVVSVLALVVLYSSETSGENRYWADGTALSDRVLSFSDTDKVALYYKAVADFKAGKTEKSLSVISRMAHSHGQDPASWYLRGRLNLGAGKINEAESDFRKALELDGDYDNALFGMALASFSGNNPGEGMRYLEKTLEINPAHPEAILFMGIACAKAGDNSRALEVCRKAESFNPFGLKTLVDLGTAYTRNGYPEKGLDAYIRACRLYPEEPMPFYNAGALFYSAGRIEEAGIWLRKAVMIDPGFEPAKDLLKEIHNSPR
ncbi:MAG: tetratricopeptide repeat protein [Candidatus Omnitrophota bacterium]